MIQAFRRLGLTDQNDEVTPRTVLLIIASWVMIGLALVPRYL